MVGLRPIAVKTVGHAALPLPSCRALPLPLCHGRAWPGHPRLCPLQHRQSWMAGTRRRLRYLNAYGACAHHDVQWPVPRHCIFMVEHGGCTEFHEGFCGPQPGSPIGDIRQFHALRAKRNIAFLRGTPWCLRVLRVENAAVNPPPSHPGWHRSRAPNASQTVAVTHAAGSVPARNRPSFWPPHAAPALNKALFRPLPHPDLQGARPGHPFTQVRPQAAARDRIPT